MRDTHKLKDKFELSLDTPQILTLTVVGVIALGGVFVLGVAVGKKLQAEDKVERPTDLLSQLDARSSETPLTFQDELTRPEAVKPRPQPIAPPVALVEAPPPPPKPAEKPLAADKPVEKVEKPVEVAVAAPREEAPAKAEDPVPTRTTPPHDAGDLKDAIARASARPAEASADGSWTLQLSAYQDKAEADRFATDLRGKGYAPFVVEAKVAGKGTWYRVRMGRFPSKDAAGRYLSDFRRETQIEAIVTTAN